MKNYCFDPTLTPPGKSVVVTGFTTDDYPYWEQLAANKDAYQDEKERIAAVFADELERKYPGFKSAIEMTDVVTPMTYVRYTGNWKGAFMTWVISPDKVKRFRTIPKTVPGLDNLWLFYRWFSPKSAQMVLNCSRADSRFSVISLASKSGGGRFSESSRLSSLSQNISRLTLSRWINSA